VQRRELEVLSGEKLKRGSGWAEGLSSRREPVLWKKKGIISAD